MTGTCPPAKYPLRFEREVWLSADCTPVFDYLDDPERLAGHMRQSSWRMGGGSMHFELDAQRGQAVGSHIVLRGRVLGMLLSVDEVVRAHDPPFIKTWETVSRPRLLVIGAYRMGFELDRPGQVAGYAFLSTTPCRTGFSAAGWGGGLALITPAGVSIACAKTLWQTSRSEPEDREAISTHWCPETLMHEHDPEHPHDHAHHAGHDPAHAYHEPAAPGSQPVSGELKDPVCGMTVTPASPHQCEFDRATYFFCSAKCLGKFRLEPARYLSPHSVPAPSPTAHREAETAKAHRG